MKVSFADETVLAVPYDMPVIGYRNRKVNTLRLWQSEPEKPFDFGLFNDMQTDRLSVETYKAMNITNVLYPRRRQIRGKDASAQAAVFSGERHIAGHSFQI